jgi:uncharacterized membrane protein
MRTAGIIIIALACLGMLLSFVSQVSGLIIQGARVRMGVTPWLYLIAAQPYHLIWIVVGLGFIALDNKLDKIANRSQ